MNTNELAAALKKERLATYVRLRGGFPVPLAGAVYWLVMAGLGFVLPMQSWFMAALFGTGAIFPLALLLAKFFKNNFMKDKQALSSLLIPAFISMLLFWPMLVAAVQIAPELAILILAIGLSIHWPVIGWMYGRTALFSAHSIIRALMVFSIWTTMPEARMTLLPLSVSLIYFATVLAILIDSGRLARAAQSN
ncbi:MAG: hypothetical protein COA47_00390 [Robiginitomaculum sp.]|nr:MAG: hypothetical protein COA47_00390 [Robiginitomaculum sp.]